VRTAAALSGLHLSAGGDASRSSVSEVGELNHRVVLPRPSSGGEEHAHFVAASPVSLTPEVGACDPDVGLDDSFPDISKLFHHIGDEMQIPALRQFARGLNLIRPG
jgi:hypothetical protein